MGPGVCVPDHIWFRLVSGTGFGFHAGIRFIANYLRQVRYCHIGFMLLPKFIILKNGSVKILI